MSDFAVSSFGEWRENGFICFFFQYHWEPTHCQPSNYSLYFNASIFSSPQTSWRGRP